MEKRNGEATRGVRRSKAERAQVLGEYRASGLTQEKFAAQAGINVGTLRGWIYKKRPAVGGEAPGHLAPVRIVGGARPGPPTRGAVTVRWPQGIEVEIAVELDHTGIERLVRTLLAPCLR
jgi:hypothetical protein